MFLAKKCCFCIKLRTGCIIIALFTLFLGILYLAEFYRLVDENDYKDDSYWYNVMIGATHLLAGFSLFYYLLRASLKS
ncbi:uncharacterized protein LOC108107889 isoform X2 [Drosophila eugracilis]|uniref:uncharacterized protein LOC108107889 isoform X2 n=1 Tax=Drosophila eugracilis TaxID=29029 RepID=UPI0007E74832|nr:uncharacterized protein LOC108107889 isoform X2 [Drosophila eugracilis]